MSYPIGLNSHALTGESGKGMRGLFCFHPCFGKDRARVCFNVENSDAALPQFR
jgi:hypothetical protein